MDRLWNVLDYLGAGATLMRCCCCLMRPDEERLLALEQAIGVSGQPSPSSSSSSNSSVNERLDRLEHIMEKTRCQMTRMKKLIDENTEDILMIRRVTDNVSYSPVYVPEHRESLPPAIFEKEHENTAEASNIQDNRPQTESSTTIDNLKNYSFKYNMDHVNQGECIIFAHQFFDNKELKERKCVEDEIKTITTTMVSKGFNVTTCRNYTVEEIKSTVKKLKRKNYSNDDCICFFILSHGSERGFIYAKDENYNISYFEKHFSKVQTLLNKPKLIFIQACRGELVDKGVNVRAQDKVDRVVSQDKIPQTADFFIANSTAPGYVSFQQWFIPTLSKTLDLYGETEDLNSILDIVKNTLSRYKSESPGDRDYDAGRQIPSIRSTLRGKVYLKKKRTP